MSDSPIGKKPFLKPNEERDIWQDINIRHGYEALAKLNTELVKLNPTDTNDKRRIARLEEEKEKINELIDKAISDSLETSLLEDDDVD